MDRLSMVYRIYYIHTEIQFLFNDNLLFGRFKVKSHKLKDVNHKNCLFIRNNATLLTASEK